MSRSQTPRIVSPELASRCASYAWVLEGCGSDRAPLTDRAPDVTTVDCEAAVSETVNFQRIREFCHDRNPQGHVHSLRCRLHHACLCLRHRQAYSAAYGRSDGPIRKIGHAYSYEPCMTNPHFACFCFARNGVRQTWPSSGYFRNLDAQVA